MKYFDIISIGSATFDIYLRDQGIRAIKGRNFISQEGVCFSLGEKISIEEMKYFPGGGGINAAITFVRQGLKTGALFNLGEDPLSHLIINQLKKEGINCKFANIKSEFQVPVSVILLPKLGERVILHTKRRHSFNKKTLKTIKRAKWIYLAPFIGEGSHLEDFHLLEYIIKEAKKNNAIIATNPSPFDLRYYKKKKSLLSFFDIFILNQEEASILTGVSYSKPRLIFKELDRLIGGIVVMTRAKKGAWISNGYWLWEVPPFKEKALLDRTGAGDGFGSGLVAGLFRLWKRDRNILSLKQLPDPKIFEEALRLAAANATSIVEAIGAYTNALRFDQFKKSKRWRFLDIKVRKL